MTMATWSSVMTISGVFNAVCFPRYTSKPPQIDDGTTRHLDAEGHRSPCSFDHLTSFSATDATKSCVRCITRLRTTYSIQGNGNWIGHGIRRLFLSSEICTNFNWAYDHLNTCLTQFF
tara:strand:- start:3684 stop:4037 length:354 start_codon:yes stop_codon:yes gene_type:complete